MTMRTFFKLYSLPFFIVLAGLALYGGVIVLVKQENLIIARPDAKDVATLEYIAQISESIFYKKDSQELPFIADSAPQSSNDTLSADNTNKIDDVNTASINTINIAQKPVEVATLEQDNQHIIDNEKEQDKDDGLLENPQSAQSTQITQSQATQDKDKPQTSTQNSAKKAIYYAKYRANVRKAADIESPVISRVYIGETLQVLGTDGEWSRIRNGLGIEGYVASRLITQVDGTSSDVYVVIPNALNVRLRADIESTIIGRLNARTRIYVLDIEGEWAKIQLPNRQYGYVSLEYIAKENI